MMLAKVTNLEGNPYWLFYIGEKGYVTPRMVPEVWSKEKGERIKQRWQYLAIDHEMHVRMSIKRVRNGVMEMPEEVEELLTWYLRNWEHYDEKAFILDYSYVSFHMSM